MYSPQAWSLVVNNEVYPVVVSLLQLAQAHNVAVPGGRHYNLPSQNTTHTIPQDAIYPPFLTSYSGVAITGADDFGDSQTTIKDIFDIIIKTTREVTQTCEFPVINLRLFDLLTRSQIKSEHSGLLGTCGRKCFRSNGYLTAATLGTHHISGPSVPLRNFPHTPL